MPSTTRCSRAANRKSKATIKPLEIIRRRPVSAALILAIWVVCLVPIPDTPLNDVRFFDKWTHLAMYAALVIVLVLENAIRQKKKRGSLKEKENNSLNEKQNNGSNYLNVPDADNCCRRAQRLSKDCRSNQDELKTILKSLAAACAMGGLIELAQAYLTAGIRSGDWIDFAANAVGAALGAVIAFPVARRITTP